MSAVRTFLFSFAALLSADAPQTFANTPSDNGSAVPVARGGIWPAPVGHRQPRAADVPSDRSLTAEDAAFERKERLLRQRLQICRGC